MSIPPKINQARPTPHHRPRTGFTLVELLVVIGIIALLISILLPSLQRARESARSVKCQANLRQFGIFAELYAAENGGRAPNGAWIDNNGDQNFWFMQVRSFLGSAEGTTKTEEDSQVLAELFTCPSALSIDFDTTTGDTHTYSSNPGVIQDVGNGTSTNWWGQGYKLATLGGRSSDVVTFMDATQKPAGQAADAVAFRLGRQDENDYGYSGGPSTDPLVSRVRWRVRYESQSDTLGNIVDPGLNRDLAPDPFSRGNVRWRHGGTQGSDNAIDIDGGGVDEATDPRQFGTAANFVFADGHTESVKIGELQERNIRAN